MRAKRPKKEKTKHNKIIQLSPVVRERNVSLEWEMTNNDRQIANESIRHSLSL
jgi:hypothetical protein